MGKRIIQRARGKGGPPYKSPSHRFLGKVSYSFTKAEVIDIMVRLKKSLEQAKEKQDAS